MRGKFIADLIRDILGPKNGLEEVIENPLSEYLTGVLGPADAGYEPQEDVLAAGLSESGSEGQPPPLDEILEEETPEEITAPPFIIPALEPRRRPVSFGLSFMVGPGIPVMDVCVTWARYLRHDGFTYRRHPRAAVVTVSGDSPPVVYLGGSGEQTDADSAEVSLHVMCRASGDGHAVSIFLVNRLRTENADGTGPERCIFQPQIRIVCRGGTELRSFGQSGILSDEETRSLEFLYRRKRVFARGFLCAAVWREIDPAGAAMENGPGDPASSDQLWWPDGHLLDHEKRRIFMVPDVRTEFIPLVAVPVPRFDWEAGWTEEVPVFNAGELSELWDPEKLRGALKPLLDGYGKWILRKMSETGELAPRDGEIAARLLERCLEIHDRIRLGISILAEDEDARLAFCFACRAMNLQHTWKTGSDLVLRPFQLGYILLVLESLVNRNSRWRETCDLLWVPTGAGKTEAYLFLIVFTIALRRRRMLAHPGEPPRAAGTAVIMRYTLRLLSIQQFRRLVSVITACEVLRVDGLPAGRIGWRPEGCTLDGDFIWGSEPFSAGLWAGGGVTPNRLRGDSNFPGAIDVLKNPGIARRGGEPAQILQCPACGSVLALPEGETAVPVMNLPVRIPAGIRNEDVKRLVESLSSEHGLVVRDVRIVSEGREFHVISLVLDGGITRERVEEFWGRLRRESGMELISASPSRPGYFIRGYLNRQDRRHDYDFEIFCPAPDCSLKRPWAGGAPAGRVHEEPLRVLAPAHPPGLPRLGDGNRYVRIHEFFRSPENPFMATRVPIPALTVDEQIYGRLPSVLVSTVDKFAGPAFEPRASAIFGNVTHHHCAFGYYREGIPPVSFSSSGSAHPHGGSAAHVSINPPDTPELIVQDELHLIDGPLGSLVGFYETAVAYLCEETGVRLKYIASTATIRNAGFQVSKLFARRVMLFPQPALDIDDSFFMRAESAPPGRPGSGRIHLGVCCAGYSPMFSIRSICARLMATSAELSLDPYWTLTVYFNSLRELGGTRALFRQDIPERLKALKAGREIDDMKVLELSSRVFSSELPAILDQISRPFPGCPDVLLTTSMFGTGVDVPRISLMIVNGQPKTTSSYIQAAGRVGRKHDGLVVVFLRSTRPRDLNHYEMFTAYHLHLHRFIEPVTVNPFAPGVVLRAAGGVLAFILRNGRNMNVNWHLNSSAGRILHPGADSDVERVLVSLRNRLSAMEESESVYRGCEGVLLGYVERWKQMARRHGNLVFVNYSTYDPDRPVVLGDPLSANRNAGNTVFEGIPRSLRDVEPESLFLT